MQFKLFQEECSAFVLQINYIHWLSTVFAYNAKSGFGAADERYKDSRTIPYELSSLLPSSVPVHPGLSPTWAETPNTRFLASGLNNDLCFAYIEFISLL